MSVFRSFRKLARDGKVYGGTTKGHRDGWGIASYRDDNGVFLSKHPSDALVDERFNKITNRVLINKSGVVIAHLRKASTGVKKTNNSHPFCYKNFIFCHNGTIINSDNIPLYSSIKKNIKGQTDSEKFFFYIIQLISIYDKKTPYVIRHSIKKAINFMRANFDYTALNFILTNGDYIWALREISDKYQPDSFREKEKYYTLYRGENKNNAVIVCSEKLKVKRDGIKWTEFRNHELLEINTANNCFTMKMI